MSLSTSSLQDCLDEAELPDGELPTCEVVDDGWVDEDAGSWDSGWSDGFGEAGDGFGTIIALMVIVALVGVAVLIWKVSTARTLARQSGMDPGLATQMTLLSENGLDATYLAANLRQPAEVPAPPASATTASAADRLAELKGLLDGALISQAEYDERRREIIDSV